MGLGCHGSRRGDRACGRGKSQKSRPSTCFAGASIAGGRTAGSDISGARAPVQSESRGVGEAGACRTVCLVECPTWMYVKLHKGGGCGDSFDPKKRDKVLRERGLDFAAAARVFEGRSRTVIDDRVDYGEVRQITYGWMEQVAVAVVWTERDGACRVISTRRMHRWEIRYVGLD